MQCSALRKNGHVVMKGTSLSLSPSTSTNQSWDFTGRPCKIVDMSTSKTGKHGHAKVHLVGIDVRVASLSATDLPRSPSLQIFTGKKLVCVLRRSAHQSITHHFPVPSYRRISPPPRTTWTFPMSPATNTSSYASLSPSVLRALSDLFSAHRSTLTMVSLTS